MVNKGKQRRYAGQFQCKCGHNWTSYDLKIQESNVCPVCRTDVLPTSVSLLTEIDTNNFNAVEGEKYFGQYQCFKCLRTWFSAHAWLRFPQKCRKCETWTEAHKLRQLQRPKGMNNKNDPKKPHETQMCAKCKQLGHNCNRYQKLIKMFQRIKI